MAACYRRFWPSGLKMRVQAFAEAAVADAIWLYRSTTGRSSLSRSGGRLLWAEWQRR